MKNTILRVFAMSLLLVSAASAAPIFSRGTAISGVVVYQDSQNASQFWYIPANAPLVLGETLQNFKVTYWGIGTRYLFKDTDGSLKSSMGAVLSGRATLDMTSSQRAAVVAEIQRVFGVQNPALLPLPLTTVHVQPVLATNTMQLNAGDVTFPTNIAFGSSFDYIVGTGNQLFAEYVATETSGPTVVANPDFAVNVVGDAEFQGDPWTAACDIDLNTYFHKAITHVSASVGWGWFRLSNAEYANVVQDFSKNLTEDCQFTEGSLDTEKYGRQIFEFVKKIMEDLNAKAASGEGFFKFEPNPDPPAVGTGGGGGAWPWTVSINASYSSATSIQDAKVHEAASYTGRFKTQIPSSMVLAVDCNSATASLFIELENPSEPCIDAAKAARFAARLQAEFDAKKPLMEKLQQDYLSGTITFEEFIQDKAILEKTSFEDLRTAAASRMKGGLSTSESVRSVNTSDILDALHHVHTAK
jgi:hypothetical protein